MIRSVFETVRSTKFKVWKPSISAWFFIISFSLAFARFLVLFFESWSIVRAERGSDNDLLQLCKSGVALESAKFRATCLQAKADQAAPIFLKVILRALKTSFLDFSEAFSTPTRLVLLVLFILSGLALPVVKMVTSVLAAHLKPEKTLDDDFENASQHVMMVDGGGSTRRNWSSKLRRIGSRRRPTIQYIKEEEDDNDYSSSDDAQGFQTMGLTTKKRL
jgi:hypothetical protein